MISGFPCHNCHFAFNNPLYCRACCSTPNAVVVTIYNQIALAFPRTKPAIMITKNIFIYFIIPLISGIAALSIPGIFGVCVGHLIKVMNCICAYINNHASAVMSMFPHFKRSIPKKLVLICVISTWRNCKKLYVSAGVTHAAISLTVQYNHKNTGIWIIMVRHPFNGPPPDFLNKAIISADIFSGWSLYFSWISCILGCISAMPFCMSVAATAFLMSNNLTMRVRRMIAIPRLPPKSDKSTIRILNIGRLTISSQRSENGFIWAWAISKNNSAYIPILSWDTITGWRYLLTCK